MHIDDDHLEVWNEGELPEGYTEETLIGRHSSKPRNRNIANAMFKAGFIDTWGRGYMKIREGFEAAGIPMPKVQNFCGGVEVTVQRTKFMKMVNVADNVTSDVTSNVTSLSPVQLTKRQREIIKLLNDNERISAVEMSRVLSVVVRTIRRYLNEMQKQGIITRTGNTSAGKWIVLKRDTSSSDFLEDEDYADIRIATLKNND
ncbi:MAG: ATP-binding protein [Prevotella sp.]